MAKIGIDAQLFIGTAGSTPTSEYENVREVGFNVERSEIDVTTRASEGWEAIVAGLKKATLEFEALPDANDSVYIDLHTAFLAGTAVAIFVTNGTEGLDADWVITSFAEDQKNDEAIFAKLKCRPTLVTRAPKWETISAGSVE